MFAPRTSSSRWRAPVVLLPLLIATACGGSDGAADAGSTATTAVIAAEADVDADPAESIQTDTSDDAGAGETTDTTDTSEAAAEPATSDDGLASTFIEETCPEAVEEAGIDGLTCGSVSVPADYDDPGGKMITVGVGVVDGGDDAAPDPVVYLAGGPGGSAIDADLVSAFLTGGVLDNRDFVMIDQRGTGISVPSLDCTEINDEFEPTIALSTDIQDERYVAAETACRARLVGEGIDSDDYNSENNARDLVQIREALGYDEWNLLGISYGTRLALTAMRDHPAGIRSVILDSTYPPQIDGKSEVPLNGERAFTALFDACAADAACSESYPDLRAVWERLLVKYDESPEVVNALNLLDGTPQDVYVDGTVLVNTLFSSMYISELIPQLPALIMLTEQGVIEQMASLALILNDPVLNPISEGMYQSVQCQEEVPFAVEGALATNLADLHPVMAKAFEQGLTSGCEIWDVEPTSPIENDAVVSEVPTLVLAGSFDPITPPEYGRLAASTLANSYFFEFPALGHGTVFDDCAAQVASSFLDDPAVEPDPTCLRSLGPPTWIVIP